MPHKIMNVLAPMNSEERIALIGLIGLAVAVVSMLVWHYAFHAPLLGVPVITGSAVAVWAMWKVRKAGGTLTSFRSKTK